MINVESIDLIGYAIGIISIVLSIIFYRISQRKHKERLARLLDPHVFHQDLLRCREKISKDIPIYKKLLNFFHNNEDGIQDLAILQQTIQNVQRYILVVRSENYEQYGTLLTQALDYFETGENDEGIKTLDKAIVLLAAEARVLGE